MLMICGLTYKFCLRLISAEKLTDEMNKNVLLYSQSLLAGIK